MERANLFAVLSLWPVLAATTASALFAVGRADAAFHLRAAAGWAGPPFFCLALHRAEAHAPAWAAVPLAFGLTAAWGAAEALACYAILGPGLWVAAG